MNCPYCTKEMESGYLLSPRQIWYSKSDCVFGMGLGVINRDEITLDSKFWDGASVKAFYCQDCKKIIVNLDDNERVKYYPKRTNKNEDIEP